MAISEGTYHIKSDGTRDYTTLYNFVDDLDVGGLTDNINAIIHGTITETATTSIGNASIDFNGYTMNIYGETSPNGDPNTGSRIVGRESDATVLSIVQKVGESKYINVHDLRLYRYYILAYANDTISNLPTEYNFYNIICDCSDRESWASAA